MARVQAGHEGAQPLPLGARGEELAHHAGLRLVDHEARTLRRALGAVAGQDHDRLHVAPGRQPALHGAQQIEQAHVHLHRGVAAHVTQQPAALHVAIGEQPIGQRVGQPRLLTSARHAQPEFARPIPEARQARRHRLDKSLTDPARLPDAHLPGTQGDRRQDLYRGADGLGAVDMDLARGHRAQDGRADLGHRGGVHALDLVVSGVV